jgi:Putative MetA-pathway of phenol degradation
MKRVVLWLLLPLAVAAQEKDTGTIKNSVDPDFAVQQAAVVASSRDGAALAQRVGIATASQALPNPAPQQKPKPAKSSKPASEPRPSFPGSMVGYIDDAVVQSQIRIRFDAGFDDNAPDRAEFFYGQCSCTGGPGPNSVVTELNFQQLYMRAEYAPTKRFSFFTEVPVRWIQPQIKVAGSPVLTNEAGLSDVTAGFKWAVVASPDRYLTFQLQADFPTGNASLGLGTNHYSAEPALLYYQKLSDRLALEAQLGDWHPLTWSSCAGTCTNATPMLNSEDKEFAGDVLFYGVGPSYVAYRGENVRIAPVIELVGWRVLGGFETDGASATANPDFQQAVSANGTNIVNLKAGVRTSVGAHSSFYVGYGHQLTHQVWYKEIVRAEYRYSF